MKKKIIALLLAACAASSMATTVGALNITEALSAADSLNSMGLFRGTGTDIYGNPIYDLNRSATRQEAITMLVRLLGKEEEALAGTWDMPFTDVADWAKPYVGYAYANGLTGGTSATTFGGNDKVTAAQYITFVLRALGYSSDTDFQWDRSWEFAMYKGLCEAGEYNEINNDSFKRGDAAMISYNAISKPHKVTGEKIVERIYADMLAAEESAIGFKEFAEAVSDARREMFSEPLDNESIKKYAINDGGSRVPLTDAEIKALKTKRNTKTVTFSEAAADIDVFFRSLKYAYGAYYYFGEEFFNELKASALSEIKGKDKVTASELDSILRWHMAQVQDGHLRRGDVDEYEYRYCKNQNYYKDAVGYYKLIDGEKWYYDGCDNEHVAMQTSLTGTGAIVYSPVWFYHGGAAVSESKIYLTRGDDTITETAEWYEGKPLSESSLGIDYQFLKNNGIAYISIRSFDNSHGASSYNGFLNSATQMKDAKAIIIDLRTNGGGTDYYPREWVKRYSGESSVQFRVNIMSRKTALVGGTARGKETVSSGGNKGEMIDNNTPVIILTDDRCGSAGEFGVQYFKTLDNSIVVGGPTAGRNFCCGSRSTLYLPNSGVSFNIWNTMYWFDDGQNRDDIGIEPDIWCNPRDALDSVLMLLVRDGIADAKTALVISGAAN
ncbi:MAG: S-layer homology domain-containing protein [Clostridia bacterium]|nr:S-layer homology domain-containing protein [Clostridia bacterium]